MAETIETRIAAFLNALSDSDAAALYDKVMTSVRTELKPSSSLPDDFEHYSNIEADGPTGADLMDVITCHLVTGGRGITDEKYPRFQLNFNLQKATGEYATPSKVIEGVKPVPWEIKDVLSAEGWESLKSSFLPSKDVEKKPSKVTIKILLHHIAYNDRRRRTGMEPIPAGTGSGTSISHLCDKEKCCNQLHHVRADQHQVNLDRQRCPGMTVLVLDGVIMQVMNCPHFETSETNLVTSPNCTRLTVIELDPTIFSAFNASAYETAHEKYVENKRIRRALPGRLSL